MLTWTNVKSFWGQFRVFLSGAFPRGKDLTLAPRAQTRIVKPSHRRLWNLAYAKSSMLLVEDGERRTEKE